jgi:hypothetical protein
MSKKAGGSDWKVFCKIKDTAAERFCEASLAEYQQAIKDESMTFVEREFRIKELSRDRTELFNSLFGGRHSKAQMGVQLLGIRNHTTVDQELLDQLSDELLKRSEPFDI